MKKEVHNYFKQTQKVYLATFGEKFPRVRPITLIYLEGEFFIATSGDDAKVKQLNECKNVEFCLTLDDSENEGYIRGAGVSERISEIEMKRKIMEVIPYIKQFWDDPAAPGYALFKIHLQEIEYLKVGEWLAKKFKV